MHFNVVLPVFIQPCTKKRRRAQYLRRVDATVFVRALQICVRACVRFSARKTSHTVLDCYSNNPERFFFAQNGPSGSPYIES